MTSGCIRNRCAACGAYHRRYAGNEPGYRRTQRIPSFGGTRSQRLKCHSRGELCRCLERLQSWYRDPLIRRRTRAESLRRSVPRYRCRYLRLPDRRTARKRCASCLLGTRNLPSDAPVQLFEVTRRDRNTLAVANLLAGFVDLGATWLLAFLSE